MSFELNRQSIGDRIHFSSVTDPKFKHNRISANFVLPLSRETASENAVVPFLLRKGCRECPDFTSLNQRLAELYGASLYADVSKHANYQVLEVSIRALDNRFALENEDIIELCASLLASVALDPKLMPDGLFDAQDVELERQYILDTIESEINEKRSYAISRCIQTMCEGESVAVRRYGDLDTAKAITRQSATAAYHRMLKTAPVELMFTGSGDPGAALRIFSERFGALSRESFDYAPLRLRTKASCVRETTERMELNQSKLVMGLRTGEFTAPEQITATRMFSAMFGGTPFSKLFLNVREKLSLCYYCASRFDSSTKLLLVDSGVEAENREKAQAEILRQLKAMQAGEFDEQEILNTKLLLKNSVITTTDSLSALEGWYMAQILRLQSHSPKQDCQSIDAVTKEQIVAAAQAVTLDTVYFLTGTQTDKEDA